MVAYQRFQSSQPLQRPNKSKFRIVLRIQLGIDPKASLKTLVSKCPFK